EPSQLRAHGVVPRRIVARIARGDAALDLLRALGETGALLLRPRALARLRTQVPLALGDLPRFLAQRVPRGLRLRDGGGRRRQLLDALLEVGAVGDDHVELVVQHVEHGTMLHPQRPQTGRALALRAEALDLVALIFDLLVLLEELDAPRVRVLLLAHPGSLLLLEQV